jgi:hypothetical protein
MRHAEPGTVRRLPYYPVLSILRCPVGCVSAILRALSNAMAADNPSAPNTTLRSRWLPIGVLLVLVCATTAAAISGNHLRFNDELEYDSLANSLLHAHNYALRGAPTGWWPPGYPFAVAAAYSLFDAPVSAKILNAICLALAVFAAARLAQRIHIRSSSIVPYVALCYPVLLYTASALYPQMLGCLLLTSVMVLISANPLSLAATALAGLLYGLLCLTIPAFLVLLPLLLAFIFLADGVAFLKRSFLKACIVAIMTVVTISPWTMAVSI